MIKYAHSGEGGQEAATRASYEILKRDYRKSNMTDANNLESLELI